MNLNNKKTILAALAAGLMCFLAYLSALNCDFINYDDNVYVYNNPAIKILDWEFIKWAFTSSHIGYWLPLTWISFAIDYQIWGLNPFGYHLTNIVLHSVNTFLVVLIADRILRQVRGEDVHAGILLLAGLLWALHPMNVESVVWIAERKNVLNGIFSLGCILLYLRYFEVKMLKGNEKVAVKIYIYSVIFFLLSLMAKSVSVVIPAMLLVLDWYPLGRLKKGRIMSVLLEKLPYILIAISIAVTTIYLAAGKSILVPLSDFSMTKRLILSGATVFDYCTLMLWPVGIVAMYLIPSPLPASFFVKTAAVVFFTCFCIYSWKRRPWLLATWSCFILPLLPTLYFFISGVHSVCAHFVYLPSIALCIAAPMAVTKVYKSNSESTFRYSKELIAVFVVALLAFYLVTTERLIASWKNAETLWTRVINIRPVGRAYFYRANYLMENNRYREAADDLQISIRMALSAGYPQIYELYAYRGDALRKTGRLDEALEAFTEAIRLSQKPNYYYHRGLVFEAMGKSIEAEHDFSIAGQETWPIGSE